MLALDDGAIARILIGATRFERDADRTALLRKFAYLAEKRPPPIARSGADQLSQMAQSSGGRATDVSVRRPRSPDAERINSLLRVTRRRGRRV